MHRIHPVLVRRPSLAPRSWGSAASRESECAPALPPSPDHPGQADAVHASTTSSDAGRGGGSRLVAQRRRRTGAEHGPRACVPSDRAAGARDTRAALRRVRRRPCARRRQLRNLHIDRRLEIGGEEIVSASEPPGAARQPEQACARCRAPPQAATVRDPRRRSRTRASPSRASGGGTRATAAPEPRRGVRRLKRTQRVDAEILAIPRGMVVDELVAPNWLYTRPSAGLEQRRGARRASAATSVGTRGGTRPVPH